MKTYKYQQILCCSSEKSLSSGMSGFGVRATSPNIRIEQAEEIYLASGMRYEIPLSMMVTAETLQVTSQLDEVYPHMYAFKKMTLLDSSEKYIVGRVMYAGADYGFFKGTGQDARVGSNYILHIMAFDQLPPFTVFAEAIRQKMFFPVNTACSASNEEFMRILVGEPYSLPEGEITLEDVSPNVTSQSGYLMLALLQAYKNRNAENQKNVILKCNSCDVEQFIQVIGCWSHEITDAFYFNANVIGQPCVPSDMRMIIINQKDDSDDALDEYHIIVDLRNGEPVIKNIESNYLFDKILEAALAADLERMNDLAKLYIQACSTESPNYEQIYRLFIMASTDDKVTLDNIVKLDLSILSKTSFNKEKDIKLWGKINRVINGVIDYPLNISNLKIALDLIYDINKTIPGKLMLDKAGAELLVNTLFATAEHFQNIIENNESRRKTIIAYLEKEKIEKPTDNAFYRSLVTSQSIAEWKDFLTYFYGNKESIANNFSEVVRKIVGSELQNKRELAKAIYPVAEYRKQWVELVNVTPEHLALVKQELIGEFESLVYNSPQENLDKILAMNEEVVKQLDLNRLVRVYAERIAKAVRSLDVNVLKDTIQKLEAFNVKNVTLNKIVLLKEKGEIIHPMYSDMKMALDLDSDKDYVLRLCENWIKAGAMKEDIVEFLSSNIYSASTAATIFDNIWKYDSSKENMLWVIDHVKMNGYDIKGLLNEMHSTSAVEFLTKESTLMKKLLRKVFGKFLIHSIALAMIFLTSCNSHQEVKKLQHYNPFRVEEYGYTQGTESVTSMEYNKSGVLLKKTTFGFTKNGDLAYLVEYDKKGKPDSTIYVYDNENMLLEIRNVHDTFQNITYNSNNQLCYYEKQTKNNKGKKILLKYSFDYNLQNKIQNINIFDEKEEKVAWTRYEYNNDDSHLSSITEYSSSQKLETSFSVENGKLTSFRKFNYPKEKLQNEKNYFYTVTYGASLIYESIDIKNDKGVSQGQIKTTLKEYKTEKLPTSLVSKIEKPAAKGDLFNDYWINLNYRIAVSQKQSSSPGLWLLIAVLFITIVWSIFFFKISLNKKWFKSFTGTADKYGMTRMWMFNAGPYVNVSLMLAIIVVAFVTSVITLLLVGGVTYLILWIFKLLVLVLIFVGWIALIGGILCILGGEPAGCLSIIVGGIVVSCRDSMQSFCEKLIDWGFNFMSDLNIFVWGLNLFINFWDVILGAFALPMLTFIVIALLIIALVFLLTSIEWMVMKVYGISRPCPICGNKNEKEYWVDKMHKHPVKLQPGIYGVFYHRNPDTGKKLPTMLLLGKDRLLRKCTKCNNYITAGQEKSFGTEKHIGIVGHRASGKSYLTYSILSRILTYYGNNARQLDADRDTNIVSNSLRITNNQGIQTDLRDSYRAIQVIIEQKFRPVPYHLFFYDVAGEKFNQFSNASKTAMDFYRNVNQIVFVVDPSMIDYSFIPCSDKMEDWLKNYGAVQKYSIEGTFSTLKSILESVGRKSRDIGFMFVLVKSDTGYLSHCGYSGNITDETIKTFMQTEIGMINIINAALGSFRSVEFEISSVKPECQKRLDKLTSRILNNLGIK